MRIFGRSLVSCLAAVWRLPQFVADVGRCHRLFVRPWDLVRAYVMRQVPGDRCLELRDGLRILLSDDPADVVTVFTVFARRDYGRVTRNAVVVDLGANIGVFALYAVWCGARKVLAYEPSAQSFDLLRRNVEINGLSDSIAVHRLAVTDTDGATVRFPRRSNVMNAIATTANAEECDEVPTTTLGAILQETGAVDLVKIDCEGAEYQILFTLSAEAFGRMGELKLEYHQGREDEIQDTLRRHGLEAVYRTADNDIGGVLWFARA